MGKYTEVYHYPDGKIKFLRNNAAFPCSAYDRLAKVDQGAIVESKRLGHALAAAKLVQDKRDNTRSLSVPTTHRTRKKDPANKPQRALNGNDLHEALADLQAHSKEIFGKT